MNRLERCILDNYDPDAWGLGIFGSIDEVAERAVASDLLVSLCEGARGALVDVAMASAGFSELLGPNGRTMPGPTTTLDDHIAIVRMESLTVEAFRAVGSALDCLAGICTLLVGLARPVQRAEGGWLMLTRASELPSAQAALWTAVVDVVADEGNRPEPGWLTWALETRNAVVHRGHLLRMWLNRPPEVSPGSRRFIVHTNTPARYLMRMEPHLRRRPWQPDIHSLSSEGDIQELWLAEPTQKTLEYLASRSVVVADRVAAVLAAAWDANELASYQWPVTAWHLEPRRTEGRIEAAEQFRGFDPSYPTPAPSGDTHALGLREAARAGRATTDAPAAIAPRPLGTPRLKSQLVTVLSTTLVVRLVTGAATPSASGRRANPAGGVSLP